MKERREPACKPGSVESSHSSWMRVAAHLERPTRELVWAHSALPYSVLLRVGFAVPQSVATCAVRSYRTFSPLPHIAVRRFVFCGTFRRLAPPRRYLAPCPAEPGLSSEVCNLSDCLADSQWLVSHFGGRDCVRLAIATRCAAHGGLGGRRNTIPGARRRTSLCGDGLGSDLRHPPPSARTKRPII